MEHAYARCTLDEHLDGDVVEVEGIQNGLEVVINRVAHLAFRVRDATPNEGEDDDSTVLLVAMVGELNICCLGVPNKV